MGARFPLGTAAAAVRVKRIAQLTDRNLVSLYHQSSGLPFGAELQSTYWYWRRRDNRYRLHFRIKGGAQKVGCDRAAVWVRAARDGPGE
jgi:hypothetical protein